MAREVQGYPCWCRDMIMMMKLFKKCSVTFMTRTILPISNIIVNKLVPNKLKWIYCNLPSMQNRIVYLILIPIHDSGSFQWFLFSSSFDPFHSSGWYPEISHSHLDSTDIGHIGSILFLLFHFWRVFTSSLAGDRKLSNCKSSQISRTLLSILGDFIFGKLLLILKMVAFYFLNDRLIISHG